MPSADSTRIIITPLEQDQGSKTNVGSSLSYGNSSCINTSQFGAVVSGVDLNNLDEESFQILREAVYTHSVIVIKDQHNLVPAKQFELVHRFDPDANPSHGFGYGKSTNELGNLGVRE